MSDDRQIHAITAAGGEIVRYDRAGKWYIEYPILGLPRQAVSLMGAVAEATRPGATVLDRRSGGTAFRAAVRRRREEFRP
jgi:hypothetical protein